MVSAPGRCSNGSAGVYALTRFPEPPPVAPDDSTDADLAPAAGIFLGVLMGGLVWAVVATAVRLLA
jgi:hypothetical protein